MFRMVAVLMLSGAAAVSAAAPQTASSVTVDEADGLYTVSASFTVAAPAASAISTLTDFAQIPRFMPEVRLSNVLERTEERAVVEQEAIARFMLFSKRIHLVLDIRQEGTVIRFQDRCGKSFARYEGAWTVDEEDGATRITYALSANPSFDVPAPLLKRLLKRDASRMVERLQAEIVARSRQGRRTFDHYCAGCHGADARGDGPAAAGLAHRPADLTLLSRSNGGAFPRERIAAFIRGAEPGLGHGTADMPNWAPIVVGLDPSNPEEMLQLDNVVAYIESLQVPSTGRDDQGARLFRAHCAQCHGDDARGMGPVTVARHPMPDLTGFALKNGGVFPSARIYRIVEGRDIDAHGSPEMPVWGRVFSRDGADAAAVQGRINAIVRYLASIQRRLG